MPLNNFQEKFKDTMLRPASDLGDVEDQFSGVFEENHISVQDRLEVYHNNIVGSLSEALCATFPLIENLVGQDFLKEMARSFVFDRPPHSGCLHFYGAGFDAFIKSYEPAKKLPYLSDVASFELAINDAYYSEDSPAMTAEHLNAIPPENLADTVLEFRLGTSLIQSHYPLINIQALCEGRSDAKIDLSQKEDCYILVNRPQMDVQILPLDADEHTMLIALRDRNTLGSAIETTLEQYPAFDFQAFLGKHISLETFSACETNKIA